MNNYLNGDLSMIKMMIIANRILKSLGHNIENQILGF